MKRTLLCFPLLLCCCAPVAQRLGTGSAAPPVARIATTLATYSREITVGSIGIDRYGNIYITDRSRQRVVSFKYPAAAPAVAAQVRFEQPLDDPGSFLVTGYQDGYCLADNLGHQLVFYSYQGQRTGSLSIAGHNATAAAIDGSGDSYVLDGADRSVLVYDPRGTLIRRFPLAPEPAAPRFAPAVLAVTPGASLVAIGDPTAGVVQYYGTFGAYIGSSPLAATALAFDQYDRLWSLDKSGSITVQSLRGATGQPLRQDHQELLGAAGVITAGFGGGALIAAEGRLVGCR